MNDLQRRPICLGSSKKIISQEVSRGGSHATGKRASRKRSVPLANLNLGTALRKIEGLAFPWRKVLQNPLWYVAVVTLLAGLTLHLQTLGWLAGVVALAWGGWLIWQLFIQTESEFDRDRPLAIYLEQVLTYQSNINQTLQATAGKRYLQQQRLAARIDLWVEAVGALVEQTSGLDHHFLLQHDLVAVPKAIKNLEKELASQTEPILRTQLEQTLSNRQKQLASLRQFQTTIKQVEIQLENTLALLGTIYSHLLAARSTNQVADYYRLLGDVDQAVDRLQDHYLYALQEVRGITEHNHLDAYEAQYQPDTIGGVGSASKEGIG